MLFRSHATNIIRRLISSWPTRPSLATRLSSITYTGDYSTATRSSVPFARVRKDEGHVNCNFISNIAEQIDDLCKLGKQIVIVSSGAGICGVGAIHKWSRRGDLNYKQALCAIGQVELMNSYKEYFSNYGRHVGQILITRDDFTDHQRELNIRNTLFTLVDEGVIPH